MAPGTPPSSDSGGGGAALLDIVVSQRDRFRQRVTQLEEAKGKSVEAQVEEAERDFRRSG